MPEYFYKRTEHNLWTVGFEDSSGKWHPDSDGTREECRARVHYLNGGEEPSQELITVAKFIVNNKHNFLTDDDLGMKARCIQGLEDALKKLGEL